VLKAYPLAISVVGMLLAALWVVFSPIRQTSKVGAVDGQAHADRI
jgi:hypothetical protein